MPSNLHIEVESLSIDRSTELHQKVLDGIEDLLLVLDEAGRVLYASPKSYPLIQIKSEALLGRYISTFMNVDDIPVFLIDFKEHMASGNSWRSHHRLRRADDTYKPFESTFKPYTDISVDDKTGSKTITKMCLMTARPYQMSSTSLMDSFLEHYTNNIRLSNQLARLRGEAEEFYENTLSTSTASIQNADTTVQRATSTIEKTAATAVSVFWRATSDGDKFRSRQRLRIDLHTCHPMATDKKQTASNRVIRLRGITIAYPLHIRIQDFPQKKSFRIDNLHETTSRFRHGWHGNWNHPITASNDEGNWCLDSQTTHQKEETRARFGVSVQRVRYDRLSGMAKGTARLEDAL
jgi:hypothetical protein